MTSLLSFFRQPNLVKLAILRGINIFKYELLFHRVCWACRVAWSILLALGARDSDSNSDRPISYNKKKTRANRLIIILCWFFLFPIGPRADVL
jgi:hypothetical protein